MIGTINVIFDFYCGTDFSNIHDGNFAVTDKACNMYVDEILVFFHISVLFDRWTLIKKLDHTCDKTQFWLLSFYLHYSALRYFGLKCNLCLTVIIAYLLYGKFSGQGDVLQLTHSWRTMSVLPEFILMNFIIICTCGGFMGVYVFVCIHTNLTHVDQRSRNHKGNPWPRRHSRHCYTMKDKIIYCKALNYCSGTGRPSIKHNFLWKLNNR